MYKTILVHVDASKGAAQRIAVASGLALLHDAHLVGTAATGLSAYCFPVGGFDPAMPAVTFPVDELRSEADRALDAFETAVRKAGVDKFERRRVDDEASVGVSLQARYADLVVISQSGPGETLPHLRADFPEYVLLNCARPVLVVPAAGIEGGFGKRIAVAWNGSADAVRAITSAIALLRAAEQVKLLVFNASKEGDMHGDTPGADMALYLARHGIPVEVMSIETDEDVGTALLAYAAGNQIDLIVMGAYGHSRFREILLGGATRTVLRSSRVPLWMAH
jgi:nucleotide-binding universal stress UspA family protein